MMRKRHRRGMVWRAALATLIAATSASAQDAVEEPSPVEVGAGDAPIELDDVAWGSGDGIRMNFQDAPLDTVLEYLSKEAGFTIVREVPVEGRVDVESHHPLNRDEVVELLNTVLNARGYAALHSGRTLTIVHREDAVQRNIPVRLGADPEQIPATDEMVTQIIPVRYTDAAKLVENLKALMAPHAVISANESSNAIVLTDTQANIRRMVEIVKALDTSISAISTIDVFVLSFADATETAALVTKVFEMPTEGENQGMPWLRGRGGGFPFGPGGGGENEDAGGGESLARKTVSRVVAVAETRTNAVVVSAPDDIMPTISQLVEEIDTASDTDMEIRVFPLQHANAEEMAELVTNVFSADAENSAQAGPRFMGPGAFFGRAFGRGGDQQNTTASGGAQSIAGDVTAVADTRTNSVIVSAPAQLLTQIEGMVAELDKNPARTKKVFVYSLKNADAETVAAIVEGMFEQQTGTRTNTNRTAGQRTTGAAATTRNTSRQNTGGATRSSQGFSGR